MASVLKDSCQKYLESSENGGYEYELFCSGYFEAIVENKQFSENKDIFSCYSTYGEYDPYKQRILKEFIKKFDSQTDGYLRAYNLLNDIIDSDYQEKCLTED